MDPVVSAFMLLLAMIAVMGLGCVQGKCVHSDPMSKIPHLNPNHMD